MHVLLLLLLNYKIPLSSLSRHFFGRKFIYFYEWDWTPRMQQVTSLEKLQFCLTYADEASPQFNSPSNKRQCEFSQLLCSSWLRYIRTPRSRCGGRRFGRNCCLYLRSYDYVANAYQRAYITVWKVTEMGASSLKIISLHYTVSTR
jgi:hypothetical protein